VWHCAGSVQAEDEAGRPEAGEAALRGTDLHAHAEAFLRHRVKLPLEIAPSVRRYVDEVQRLAAADGASLLIEHRLDLSRYHPELFGTLDAAVIDFLDGVLTIVDFKSGVHPVPADALQLKLYAAMIYLSLPAFTTTTIRRIDTVVVQPNGDGEPIKHARHRVAELINTLAEYVERTHVATGTTDPPRTARPWCREHYCAARRDCPAFAALAGREAQVEFTAASEGDPGTD
jgi:hypothetical protein